MDEARQERGQVTVMSQRADKAFEAVDPGKPAGQSVEPKRPVPPHKQAKDKRRVRAAARRRYEGRRRAGS